MSSVSADAGSLWDALCSVPDHRRAEGKRYPLPSLLLIAVAEGIFRKIRMHANPAPQQVIAAIAERNPSGSADVDDPDG